MDSNFNLIMYSPLDNHMFKQLLLFKSKIKCALPFLRDNQKKKIKMLVKHQC